MDAGILRKLSAVFKKKQKQKSWIPPFTVSCSEPGSYRVTRIQTLEYILKSAIPAICWNDGIQFHRIWLQGSQICQVLKGILKCKWKDVLLNEHIYK